MSDENTNSELDGASYEQTETEIDKDNESEQNDEENDKHPEEEQTFSQETGQAKVFQRLQNGELKFPPGFTTDDLHLVLETIDVPQEFNGETLESYYQECLNQLKEDIVPDPEEPGEEDESLILNEDFIKDRLSDLQPVEGQHLQFAFTSFSVSDADISDLSALSSFHTLLYISLKTNLLTNVSPLSGLERLRELNLAENKIISFADIELPSLEILNLSSNGLRSISNLRLPKLKKLILSQNKIYFISPGAFDQCKELETIELQENKLKYFKDGAFHGLTSLKSIKFNQNNIKELPEGIFNDLTSVTSIDFSENPIETISGLFTISTLKSLNLSQTAVPDFEAIKGLSELKNMSNINLDGAPVQGNETYKSDLILLMPWLESIDGEPIQFSDRQEAMALDKERKAEEERARKEREEAEADQETEEKDETEEGNDSAQQPNDTASESYSTYEPSS